MSSATYRKQFRAAAVLQRPNAFPVSNPVEAEFAGSRTADGALAPAGLFGSAPGVADSYGSFCATISTG